MDAQIRYTADHVAVSARSLSEGAMTDGITATGAAKMPNLTQTWSNGSHSAMEER